MPELPEAERARQQIERVLGREIVAVDDRDTYVCRPHAPGEIAAALTGRRLTQARTGAGSSCGSRPTTTARTSGCTSAWRAGSRSTRTCRRGGWDRFALDFAGGGRMALRDKRRLGRARDRAGLLARRAGRGRGRARRLPRARRPRHAPIKARLLDQGVIAGVGNLLADETLWRARLSPARRAGELSVEELDRLRRELRAADARRDPQRRRPHRALHAVAGERRRVPALRHPARARHGRRAHDVLVPARPAQPST